MIKFENTDTNGWEAAIRGMRNPLNSWDKSDSGWNDDVGEEAIPYAANIPCVTWTWQLGPNDLDLMKRLRKAGSDHRKYLRMIIVTVDITAPLYWWKEFDTYKVGTVANSCSTMHTIHKKEFSMSDFSCEMLNASYEDYVANKVPMIDISGHGDMDGVYSPGGVLIGIVIPILNRLRDMYNDTKDKKYWYQMIQLLPASYNQRRTVQMSYENLIAMYYARKDHKLDEWHAFCDWISNLPYAKDLIIGEEKRA